MEAVIFVPMLLAVYGLFRWGPQKTLLNVCLPCLFLLPTYYYWKTHGGMDFGMSVAIPLGMAMIGFGLSRWKLTRTDLWIALYIVSTACADFRSGEVSLARYIFADVLLTALVPYMAGKLLIERNARLETAKRIVLVLCLSCVAALPECFLKVNLYLRGWMHFFPGQWPGWYTQLRWGFGRVAGPCGSPELYGLVLMVALLLLLWVRRRTASKRSLSLLDWSSSKTSTLFLVGLLLTTSFLTVSRGPWVGTLLAILIASIGRAKHVRRTALIVCVLCVVMAFPAYQFMQAYASGPRKNYGTDRETAQYRREMLENYLPLAKAGGLWGWGTFHPILASQPSIDNEFLRVFLVQGYMGVVTYLLLFVEAAYAVLRVGLSKDFGDDRHFCFTILGILAGWALTLSTVYMGGQSYQLFFLIVGWTQAMPRHRILEEQEDNAIQVVMLNQVYT